MYKSKLAVKVCFSNLVNTAIMESCDLTLITLFMPAKLTPNMRAPVAPWPRGPSYFNKWRDIVYLKSGGLGAMIS